MNEERSKFWVTCPSCKHKFGIRSQTVLKYVDRLLNELGEEIKKTAEEAKERARKKKES